MLWTIYIHNLFLKSFQLHTKSDIKNRPFKVTLYSSCSNNLNLRSVFCISNILFFFLFKLKVFYSFMKIFKFLSLKGNTLMQTNFLLVIRQFRNNSFEALGIFASKFYTKRIVEYMHSFLAHGKDFIMLIVLFLD